MSAIADFFYFNGYAWYVWGSYGVTAAFVVIELWMLSRNKKATTKRLARMARLQENNAGEN